SRVTPASSANKRNRRTVRRTALNEASPISQQGSRSKARQRLAGQPPPSPARGSPALARLPRMSVSPRGTQSAPPRMYGAFLERNGRDLQKDSRTLRDDGGCRERSVRPPPHGRRGRFPALPGRRSGEGPSGAASRPARSRRRSQARFADRQSRW